jgi:hypothetical protein
MILLYKKDNPQTISLQFICGAEDEGLESPSPKGSGFQYHGNYPTAPRFCSLNKPGIIFSTDLPTT